MSHTCPECGMVCRCCGDIDDCLLDLPYDQEKCEHWKDCQEDESGELFEDEFEEE